MGRSSASKPCNENACMNERGALQYIDRKRYAQMDGAFPSFPEMSEVLSKEKMYG